MADGYPQCSLVNDRPVKIFRTPDGGADIAVLDWRSGSFVIDRTYWTRTIPGDFRDVDAVTPERMDAIVAGHRAAIVRRMTDDLAAASGAPPDSPPFALLGLDDGTVPFDGAAVEALRGPGILVIEPQLLRRALLDEQLGAPGLLDAPDGRRIAAYALGSCAVTAVFPDDDPGAHAVLVSIVRVAPSSPTT